MNQTLKQTATALGLAATITLSILAGLDTLASQHHAAAALAAAAAPATQAAQATITPQRSPRG